MSQVTFANGSNAGKVQPREGIKEDQCHIPGSPQLPFSFFPPSPDLAFDDAMQDILDMAKDGTHVPPPAGGKLIPFPTTYKGGPTMGEEVEPGTNIASTDPLPVVLQKVGDGIRGLVGDINQINLRIERLEKRQDTIIKALVKAKMLEVR